MNGIGWKLIFPKETGIRQLDIGCGNGALLNALAPKIEFGVGVDESSAILEEARVLNENHYHFAV